MERSNWFYLIAVILLLTILATLWRIKEEYTNKKETDAAKIRSTRRFRKFEQKDDYFRKNQRKINQEIVRKLKQTYSQYKNIEVLNEELLGIQINIKTISEDFSFMLTAIASLFLSLIPAQPLVTCQ